MDAARRTIAFYATVRTYRPIWEMHGFADAAAEAGDAFRRATSRPSRRRSPTRWWTPSPPAGPLDKVRARVEDVA